jgi:hypothetical protein
MSDHKQHFESSGLVITASGKAIIQAILNKAVEDLEFRAVLTSNPGNLPEIAGLGKDERTLLFSLRRVAMEEAGIDVRACRRFMNDNGAPFIGKVE